jgi:hypothetical protein
MKNDEQEVNPNPESSNTENPASTTQPPANNNGQETSEPGHDVAADANGKRTFSRKVEASRRNGRKGAGPKTAAGKKRVSQNAIKHGFYSKWLLVKDQDGEESQPEYDKFYAEIAEYFQPEGWLEKDLVDKIAAWSWRLRRVIRYESGQIARNLAEHRYDLEQSKATSAEEPGSMVASSSEIDAMTDHLLLTTEGLENQLRYEAMINRQLNHAIAELERVQAARKRKK